MGKLPAGTKVIVTRGGHKGKTATVVEGPRIDLCLCVGDAVADSFTEDLGAAWPHQVYLKFDDDAITGGEWGTGLFRYTIQKIRVI